MKQTLLIFLSFLLVAFHCEAQKAVVTGKLPPGTLKLYLMQPKSYTGLNNYVAVDSVTTNQDGSFKINLDTNQDPVYLLQTTENYVALLYLEAGDSLHLVINELTSMNAVQFSGQAGDKNKFFSDFNNVDLAFYKQAVKDLPINAFEKALLEQKAALEKRLDDFMLTHKTSPQFQNYFRAAALYRIEFYRYEYLLDRPRYEGSKENYLVADTAYYTTSIDMLQRDDLVLHPDYQFFLRKYFNDVLLRAYYTDKQQNSQGGKNYSRIAFDNAAALLTGKSRDLALTQILSEYFIGNRSVKALADAGNMISVFEAVHSDKSYLDYVKNYYSGLLAVAPGAKAPDFTLHDAKGRPVSLSGFKGKVVVIDFWATWCGYCIAAFPQMRQLEKAFKNKDVVFLSIAVEENKHKKWLEFLRKFKPASINLYSEGGLKGDAIRAYQLNSVPHYMLIDKNGRIYSASAAVPESEQISKALSSGAVK